MVTFRLLTGGGGKVGDDGGDDDHDQDHRDGDHCRVTMGVKPAIAPSNMSSGHPRGARAGSVSNSWTVPALGKLPTAGSEEFPQGRHWPN